MLPKEGLTLEAVKDVYANPDEHWLKMCESSFGSARHLSIPLVAEAIAREPVVAHMFDIIGTVNEERPECVRRGMTILYEALGPRCLSVLFGFSVHGTVCSVLRIASAESEEQLDRMLDKADVQITVLASAIDCLVGAFSGSNPSKNMMDILNRLELPYFQHRTIIDALTPRLPHYVKTLN